MSAQGLQQGDPFCSISYCLTSAPALKDFCADIFSAQLLKRQYFWRLAGSLIEFWVSLARSNIGLDFSLQKCEIVALSGAQYFTRGSTDDEKFLAPFPWLQRPSIEQLERLSAKLTPEYSEYHDGLPKGIAHLSSLPCFAYLQGPSKIAARLKMRSRITARNSPEISMNCFESAY